MIGWFLDQCGVIAGWGGRSHCGSMKVFGKVEWFDRTGPFLGQFIFTPKLKLLSRSEAKYTIVINLRLLCADNLESIVEIGMTIQRTKAASQKILSLFGLFVLLQVGPVIAQSSDGFCLIPVEGGQPTAEDLNSAGRILGVNEYRIPGLPGPVFTPHNREGVWTITPEARLVPYEGPFPTSGSSFNKWAFEPEHNRVVAANLFDSVIYTLRSDGAGFQKLVELPDKSLSLHRLDSIQQTVFSACDDSGCQLYHLIDDALVPWLSADDAAILEGREIQRIRNSQELQAQIIVTYGRRSDESSRLIFLKPYDGNLVALGGLGRGGCAA